MSLETLEAMKCAVLCESTSFWLWEIKFFKQILNMKNMSILFIIILNSGQHKSEGLFKFLSKHGIKHAFYYIFHKIYLRQNWLTSKSALEIIRNTCVIYENAHSDQKSADTFEKSDLKKLKNAKLDFILSFSDIEGLQEDMFKQAKYGIWCIFVGNGKYTLSRAPGYWEYYRGKCSIEVSLVKFPSDPINFIIIKKGIMPISGYSYSKTVNDIYFNVAGWLKEFRHDRINKHQFCGKRTFIGQFLRKQQMPNNLEMISFVLRLAKRILKRYLKNLFFCEQWTIGYIDGSAKKGLEDVNKFRIKWILSPSRREFYADPFPIEVNNRIFIFYEKYDYTLRKGNIAVIELKEKAEAKNVDLLDNNAHHLSFPFVFKDGNDIYMVAEQWKTGEIALYKEKSFPYKWQKAATLIGDVKATDPIIFKFDGYWWLFFTTIDNNPDLNLFIYYSDTLFGCWMPHKKNPAKTDINSSRCAGGVFSHKDWLIRPAQNCSKAYGTSVVLNRIITLSPDEFEEESIAGIFPKKESKYNSGIHTFNLIKDTIVIDGKRSFFSFANFIQGITKQARLHVRDT